MFSSRFVPTTFVSDPGSAPERDLGLLTVLNLLLLVAVFAWGGPSRTASAPHAPGASPTEPRTRPHATRERPPQTSLQPESHVESSPVDTESLARARHSTPSAEAPETPLLRAALLLGGRLFVLLEPTERSSPHASVSSPSSAHRAGSEVVPLTQGNVLFVEPSGPAESKHYTLASRQGACTTTTRGRVWLQLDSGNPEPDAELGPTRQADEVRPCGVVFEPGVPLLAFAGEVAVEVAEPELSPVAGRAGADPEARVGLALDATEYLDVLLELRSQTLGLVRSTRALDSLKVIPLHQPSVPMLDTNGSLSWDSQAPGC